MSTRVTVIAYHAIGDCSRKDDMGSMFVSLDRFQSQMAFLEKHRTVVTLDDAIDGVVRQGPPAVAITFDDAYRSVHQHALPVLEAHGFAATVFVPTKFIGDRNRWDPPSRCPLEIMTADELRDAEARGLAVELHSHQHPHLERASEADAAQEINASADVLRHLTGRAPRFLAYPFSHGSPDAQRAAESAGLHAAFSIDRPGTSRFDFPRVPITPFDGPATFRVKTSGNYLALRFSPIGRFATLLTRPLRHAHRASSA